MAIIQFLGAIIKILGSFLAGIAQLLYNLPGAVYMLTMGIASMPSVVMVFATAFVSVSVVYLIIGR